MIFNRITGVPQCPTTFSLVILMPMSNTIEEIKVDTVLNRKYAWHMERKPYLQTCDNLVDNTDEHDPSDDATGDGMY